MSDTDNTTKYISVTEAAKQLSVSRRFITRRLDSGVIPSLRVNKIKRLVPVDFIKYIEEANS